MQSARQIETCCRILQGDSLTLLREMPAGSVRCCVTSPPYWGLRDYGTATWEGGDAACDHRHQLGGEGIASAKQNTSAGMQTVAYRDICGKCGARRVDAQLGLEKTPEEYVAKMVEVFREVKRVLADDGTLWLNLGDSYHSQPAGNSRESMSKKQRSNNGSLARWRMSGASDSAGDLSAVGIGGAVQDRHGETALKPKDLVGIPWRVAFALQADGWYLRSDIIWAKPNPMPESVTDRPTKAHEYLFLLAKSQRYYYDAKAIREPQSPASLADHTRRTPKPRSNGVAPDRGDGDSGLQMNGVMTSGFRNRRTVWTITPKPFKGAHFAVMPEALVEPCVLAGSAPGDLVLDPFTGSGTVGVVALRHGRNFVGCELNPEYVSMARNRIVGPLLGAGQ